MEKLKLDCAIERCATLGSRIRASGASGLCPRLGVVRAVGT